MRGKRIIGMTIAFAMLLSAMPLAIPAAKAESTPTVYIYPALSTPEVGSFFTVDLKISGVTGEGGDDLYTWSVRLKWAAIMIDFENATEGHYLKDYQYEEGTYFIVGELPPARNFVDLACTLLGPYTGACGNGTLASITFEVLDIGLTKIEITDIELIDSGLHLKPYDKVDGTVDVHSDWITNPAFYAMLQEKRVANRHWSLSIMGYAITLYVKIKNIAWVPLKVQGCFVGKTPIGKRTWRTNIKAIQPNEVSEFLTWVQALTEGMVGTYTMQVYAEYSYGGSRWFADTHPAHVKSLTFVVVD